MTYYAILVFKGGVLHVSKRRGRIRRWREHESLRQMERFRSMGFVSVRVPYWTYLKIRTNVLLIQNFDPTFDDVKLKKLTNETFKRTD